MAKIIFISGLVGILGTTLGGLLGLLLKNKKLEVTASAFSAGFMLSVSAFELIYESVSLAPFLVVVLGFVFGSLFVRLFSSFAKDSDRLLIRLSKKNSPSDKASLKSGLAVTFAIALHNLPEGLAIGASETVGLTLPVALLIALHDLPEGLALSLPLLSGGASFKTTLFICLLSGLPTALGGILGYFLSFSNVYFSATCLSVAAGAMCEAVFFEILPNSLLADKNSKTAVSLGFVIGMTLSILL